MPSKVAHDGILEKELFLKNISKKLNEVVEELANGCDGMDIVMPVDNKLFGVALAILLFNEDESELVKF